MSCLDDLTITNLVGNTLPEPARVSALAHLDECATCYELVAAMAIGSPRAGAAPARLAPGTHVGRYIVERVAGAGAMGVVYAARDPSLDRAVALKCVAARGDGRATERMLREARTMAQLSHRNVVSIFDVGTFGDDVFLALELVRGRTLREWLAEAPRTTREIVAVLVDAGRGLAAAHAAGIVHRDVKPDNMLVADDGRACVTDFGLARPADDAAEAPPPADTPVDELTATGAVVGTPVYMAPEQLAGAAADARSDQFSLCVVAYECLAGKRPFEGRTIAELRDAIAHGPSPAALPARLHRVLARGLSVDPAARFGSIDDVIAALDHDPAVRRRRLAIGGIVALAAVAIAYVIPRPHDACPDPRDRLAGVWDDARRGELALAFSMQVLPFTGVMRARARDGLDRYADHWVALRGDACRATYERRDQSEARYDAELACLDRRRSDLAATVQLLTEAPDAATVQHAVAVVQGLPELEPCRDGAALVDQTPLPSDPPTRVQVEAVEHSLAAAVAIAKVSKFHEALAIVDGLVPRARALGFGPTLAHVLYYDAKLRTYTGADPSVETMLDEAARLAAADKDDALAARIAIVTAYTAGAIERRFAEAASLDKVARIAVQRAGDPDSLVIDWHDAVGAALAIEGKYAEAVPHFRDALAIAEKPSGSAHDRLGERYGKLAAILDNAGKLADAREPAERAVAIIERELGPDHPDLAFALLALAAINEDDGRYDDSLRLARRALAIVDRLGEPPIELTTEALEAIGNSSGFLGRLDEARAAHERVLAIRERAGPREPRVGESLVNLGKILVQQGHVEEARADYDRAIEIFRAAYGPDHPMVGLALRQRAQIEMGSAAAVLDLERALAISTAADGPDSANAGVDDGNLAGAYGAVGRWPDARLAYERAVAISEKTYGPTHPFTAMGLAGLGQALVELHEPARSIPVLERALAILQASSLPASQRGAPRWFLVQALTATGDPARAQIEARQARRDVDGAQDPTSVGVRTSVDRWLADHGRRP